ncbi:MAG: hypothetical protein A2075_11470 [Geobacteraceae bacterium GWC2_58_44]|nr:MAG: hypothetical protein A2075_11470 [Geobacteraceae bacterium GWC2_58_44]HBG04830.1 heparinase [Geobacter sp.]
MFNFLFSRLKHASLPELAYRVRQTARGARIRRAVRRGRFPYALPEAAPRAVRALALPEFHPAVSRDTVEAVLAGARFTLNTDRETLLRWEAELAGGQEANPAGGGAAADIRALWEPARLQHVTLLLAYLSRQGAGYAGNRVADFARRELLGWLDANPFLAGPHYRSAMECALRIPVFFYALKLLETLDRRDFKRLSDAAYAHAGWIEDNLSLYSSLGNHTVCESVGLLFAGAMFADTGKGKLWLERGIALLRQELARQILPDGGPLEQSLSYHRLVLDLYWLSVDFLEGNGLHDCSDWKPRLRQGEAFLAAFCDGAGRFPPLGDSDDGHALAPGLAPRREAAAHEAPGCRAFDAAGYTLITGADGLRVSLDHGPLGMPPLNNHGHADALSLTLSLAGDDLLVDPGTYRYNGAPSFRRYFKSTAAHNTVTVDGLDQAQQETGFIWSNPYQCRVLRREQTGSGYLVEAEHDGYRRLPEPVLHRRALLYAAPDAVLLRDSFSGGGEHDFALHFHLHPDAEVTRDAGWWFLRGAKSRIRLRLLEGEHLELATGKDEPTPGWYAPAYGSKRPAAVLRCRKRGVCRLVEFRTVICWGDNPDMEWLQALGGAL